MYIKLSYVFQNIKKISLKFFCILFYLFYLYFCIYPPVMCQRRNLKEMCDCKVIVNECVAKQHHMVVCKMVLIVKRKK